MAEVIELFVPGEPVGKGRAIVTKFGTFTPKKTRIWEGIARTIAFDAMAGRPPMAGPIRIELAIYHSIPRSWPDWKRAAAGDGTIRPTSKPDWSNVVKALEDALNAIVWRDDSQIVAVEARKYYADGVDTTPGVRAQINELPNAAAAQLTRKADLPARA